MISRLGASGKDPDYIIIDVSMIKFKAKVIVEKLQIGVNDEEIKKM